MLPSSSIPSPVLFEEIGQGASGASVRRCTFGELIAAAKVFTSPEHLIRKFSDDSFFTAVKICSRCVGKYCL